MELTGIRIESDKTWMKMADMMVETGMIADFMENEKARRKEPAGARQYGGPRGSAETDRTG